MRYPLTGLASMQTLENLKEVMDLLFVVINLATHKAVFNIFF